MAVTSANRYVCVRTLPTSRTVSPVPNPSQGGRGVDLAVGGRGRFTFNNGKSCHGLAPTVCQLLSLGLSTYSFNKSHLKAYYLLGSMLAVLGIALLL